MTWKQKTHSTSSIGQLATPQSQRQALDHHNLSSCCEHLSQPTSCPNSGRILPLPLSPMHLHRSLRAGGGGEGVAHWLLVRISRSVLLACTSSVEGGFRSLSGVPEAESFWGDTLLELYDVHDRPAREAPPKLRVPAPWSAHQVLMPACSQAWPTAVGTAWCPAWRLLERRGSCKAVARGPGARAWSLRDHVLGANPPLPTSICHHSPQLTHWSPLLQKPHMGSQRCYDGVQPLSTPEHNIFMCSF